MPCTHFAIGVQVSEVSAMFLGDVVLMIMMTLMTQKLFFGKSTTHRNDQKCTPFFCQAGLANPIPESSIKLYIDSDTKSVVLKCSFVLINYAKIGVWRDSLKDEDVCEPLISFVKPSGGKTHH